VQQIMATGVSTGEAIRTVMATDRLSADLPPLALKPDAHPAAQQLAHAGFRLDGPTCSGLLRDQVARNGVVHTWESVLRPVMGAIGDQWPETAHGIAVEHVLSQIASVVLAETVRRPATPSGPAVYLACAPGELHDLPMVALHSALAVGKISSVLLGARTPAATLTAAAARHQPAVVVIFCLLRDWADEHALTGFPPDVAVVAAGPGWSRTRLPETVEHVDDLRQATQLVTNLTGAPYPRTP
jgi:methanogenic corrinoid protein MtbC1